jgi:hypothetical protein
VLAGLVTVSGAGSPTLGTTPFSLFGTNQQNGGGQWASMEYLLVGNTTAAVTAMWSITSAVYGCAALTLRPGPAPGTPYLMCEGKAGIGSTTLVQAVATANANGDCLAAWVARGAGATITSVSDPVNGNWTKVGSVTQLSAITGAGQWFISPNAGVVSTSQSITATYGGTAGVKYMIVIGIPNVSTSPADPAVNAANDTPSTTTPTISTGKLTTCPEIILAGLLSNDPGGSPTWTSPFTLLGSVQLQGTTFYNTAAWSLRPVLSAANPAASVGIATDCAMAVIALSGQAASGTQVLYWEDTSQAGADAGEKARLTDTDLSNAAVDAGNFSSGGSSVSGSDTGSGLEGSPVKVFVDDAVGFP